MLTVKNDVLFTCTHMKKKKNNSHLFFLYLNIRICVCSLIAFMSLSLHMCLKLGAFKGKKYFASESHAFISKETVFQILKKTFVFQDQLSGTAMEIHDLDHLLHLNNGNGGLYPYSR